MADFQSSHEAGGGPGSGQLDLLGPALQGATSWFEVYTQFRATVPEGQEENYRALVWAFAYDLMGPEQVDRRDREGSPFGAMFEFAEGRMPPKLADVPQVDLEVWVQAFDAVLDPRSRSRLGDLLWEVRAGPRPDQHARAAATALLELSDDPDWEDMEATQGLVRALELARSVSDSALVDLTSARMTLAIRNEMTVEERRPGIPFSLLRSLVDLPLQNRPHDLGELIALCEERYSDDPFQINTAIDLRTHLADGDETKELRKRQVTLWRDRANEGTGLEKLSFFRTALDLASTHGLSIEAEELRVELAEVTDEELDLAEVSAEIKVPREDTEKFLNFFIETDGWHKSLTRFAIHGPPGGEPDALAETVAKQMREHPIQYLVTKMVLDPDIGIPIFEAKDDESHVSAARAEHRMFGMRLWGAFAVQILVGIEDRFGRPDRKNLVDFFTTDLVDAANAERMAVALELWWDGEYDLSAHLLAPRLETVIREMARQLGLAIVREPVTNRPGRVRSLGELLRALEGRIGTPGWHAYLTSLLADPLGLNLRNVVGHGLRPEIGVDDAALLIHAACYLAMLGQSERAQEPES